MLSFKTLSLTQYATNVLKTIDNRLLTKDLFIKSYNVLDKHKTPPQSNLGLMTTTRIFLV